MPHFTDIGNLFITYRSEARLKHIVKKAKAMLAADKTFFESRKRRCGERILDPALEPPHRLFIKETLMMEPERILTTNDCFENYTTYCKLQLLQPAWRKPFTGMMTEGIKEEFGLGFRKDLKDVDGKWLRGWKGLACHIPDVAETRVSGLVEAIRN